MDKFYAIKGEEGSTIVRTWDEAQVEIKKYTKVKYKKFSSLEEAKAFNEGRELSDNISEPKCYIDGSFDSKTNRYSFGGVLIIDGHEYEFKRAFEEDNYSQYRNVAGEIRGAGYIINYCVNKGIKKLHLFYDYKGIECWYLREWKANTEIAINYQLFADSVRNKIEVVFHKVKSHTNDKYNDMADMLAKEALGI